MVLFAFPRWLMKLRVFSYAYWTHRYPLLWNTCSTFPHFLIGFSVILLIDCKSFIYSVYEVLGQIYIYCKYLLPLRGLSFHSLKISLDKQKFYILMSNYQRFSLWLVYLVPCLRNIYLLQGHYYILLCFRSLLFYLSLFIYNIFGIGFCVRCEG